jgi:alanine racemase
VKLGVPVDPDQAEEYLTDVDTSRVWAEIDLDALAHNLTVIRRRAGSGVGVMIVVKADAYGHGAVAIAHHAVRCGVAALGVGTSGEALELRAAGLRVPILVLGTVVDEEVPRALRHGIEIGLHSSDRLHQLEVEAKRLGLTARVHLNVDTGMGRLGVLPIRALELLREVKNATHLHLAGVMTHISSPEGNAAPETAEQVRQFNGVIDAARAEGIDCGRVHLANSASLFSGLRPLYNTVRLGIAAFGVLPESILGTDSLHPVLSLRSQVVFLKDIPAGTPVGYGSTWRAHRPTRVATLPVGYNDGVPWSLSNRGGVLLAGQRAPIVGCVSMDYTTVDVGAIDGVRVGDVATLIGTDGNAEITVAQVAREAGTIPYEITCSVGKRVPRICVGGETLPLPSQASPEPEQQLVRARGALPQAVDKT